MALQVAIKDEQSARNWLENVQAINQDYYAAMEGATIALKRMREVADGAIIDEIVNLGDGMLNAAQTVFQGIDTIADTVTEVIGTVGEFIDDAKGLIHNAINTILGR